MDIGLQYRKCSPKIAYAKKSTGALFTGQLKSSRRPDSAGCVVCDRSRVPENGGKLSCRKSPRNGLFKTPAAFSIALAYPGKPYGYNATFEKIRRIRRRSRSGACARRFFCFFFFAPYARTTVERALFAFTRARIANEQKKKKNSKRVRKREFPPPVRKFGANSAIRSTRTKRGAGKRRSVGRSTVRGGGSGRFIFGSTECRTVFESGSARARNARNARGVRVDPETTRETRARHSLLCEKKFADIFREGARTDGGSSAFGPIIHDGCARRADERPSAGNGRFSERTPPGRFLVFSSVASVNRFHRWSR